MTILFQIFIITCPKSLWKWNVRVSLVHEMTARFPTAAYQAWKPWMLQLFLINVSKLLMKHHYQSLRAFHSQLSVARYLCCLDNSNLSITIYMWKNYSALYCSPFQSNMARLLAVAMTALVISWVHGRTAYIPASKYFWQKIL